jgi:alanyl-tRNA synthetase
VLGLAITGLLLGAGYFVWEQQKAKDAAVALARQQAEISLQQAKDAQLKTEEAQRQLQEAKKQSEQVALETLKQASDAKRQAQIAQQQAAEQKQIATAAIEQAEAEKRKADELAQQLKKQTPPASNVATIASWTGYLTCSINLTDTSKGSFTKKININTNRGYGSILLKQGGTTEKYTLSIANNGVKINSEGYWDNNNSNSWIITTEGNLNGKNINTYGSMYSSDKKTLIRNSCQFSLAIY